MIWIESLTFLIPRRTSKGMYGSLAPSSHTRHKSLYPDLRNCVPLFQKYPVFLNLVFNLEMVLWPTPNLAATTLCLTPASSWPIACARSRLDNLGMFAHCWQTCILTMVSNTGHWVHSEHLLSSFTISELSMKEPKRCWLVWILWTTAQLQFLALLALDPLPVWGLITNHRNVA